MQGKGLQRTDEKFVGVGVCGRRCAEVTAQVLRKHASGGSLHAASGSGYVTLGTACILFDSLEMWLVNWGDYTINIYFFLPYLTFIYF